MNRQTFCCGLVQRGTVISSEWLHGSLLCIGSCWHVNM